MYNKRATKQQLIHFSYYSIVQDTIFYTKMTKNLQYFSSKVKVSGLSYFKFAPSTYVVVNRSFSSYESISRDCRHNILKIISKNTCKHELFTITIKFSLFLKYFVNYLIIILIFIFIFFNGLREL